MYLIHGTSVFCVQTFVWDQLPRGHWNAYWFGLSDESTEDDWVWVDGTKLVGGYSSPVVQVPRNILKWLY